LVLSVLESGSVYSAPVWRSLTVARTSWIAFRLRSGLIILAGCLVAYMRVLSNSTVWNFCLASATLLLMLLYARLLGRLSWVCDSAMAELDGGSGEE
jgi:hypothetical protein